jgi:16S rRNA (guanine1207-N2)-methyltransferase
LGRRSDPQWRDIAARSLVLGQLEGARVDRALVMLEGGTEIRAALEALGAHVVHWDRRASGGAALVSAWPPEGHFDWIGLRLPKGTEELRMLAQVAASRLAPGGVLWIYGARDEGVQSVKKRLKGHFGDLRDVAIGGRCRVIQAGEPAPGFLAHLSDWIQPMVDERLSARPWVSFPGCFAHGRVDQGTELLLAHLPEIPASARVLDFACGSGVVAGAVRSVAPEAEIVLLDNDALSLEAAHRNLPQSMTVLSQGFSGLRDMRFDWILSNPPYHMGKAGTSAVLEELCLRAPEYLRPGGGLRCVVQATHAIAPLLKENFHEVSVVFESPIFRVWNCRTTT